MFLHGGWFHLGFNMLFLWIFGNNIEDHLGPVKFVAFYLAVRGGRARRSHRAAGGQHGSARRCVRRSGGRDGCLLHMVPARPDPTLALIFLIDIKAVYWLGLWFILQFFTGQDSGIAWAAHVGGFVFGASSARSFARFGHSVDGLGETPGDSRRTTDGTSPAAAEAGGPPRFGSRSW